MIVYLTGTLQAIDGTEITLLTHGVGYGVTLSERDIAQLPPLRTIIELFTWRIIKESEHRLYGFLQPTDREGFHQLTKLNGIGPKLAMTMLSHCSWIALCTAIQCEELSRFTDIPGIGKKMAERLLLELKGRPAVVQRSQESSLEAYRSVEAVTSRQVLVLDALQQLGYRLPEAKRLIALVGQRLAEDASSAVWLKEALRAAQELQGA